MPDHSHSPSLDRRTFLKAGAAIGGGLVVNLVLPLALRPALAQTAASPGFAPNAFIRMDRQGGVTLVMPMVEMGQGIYTAMAMLLAEELEVGLDQVRLEHAPPDDALYANSLLHIQTTGLSASVRAFCEPFFITISVSRRLPIIWTCASRLRGDCCNRRDGPSSRSPVPRTSCVRAEEARPIAQFVVTQLPPQFEPWKKNKAQRCITIIGLFAEQTGVRDVGRRFYVGAKQSIPNR